MILEQLPHGSASAITIAIAILVLSQLSRWDGAVSARDAEIRAQIAQELRETGLDRALIAETISSLAAQEARADSLAALSASSRRRSNRLELENARLRDALTLKPIGEAIEGTPLLRIERNLFQTDSAGAREIAIKYLDASQLALVIVQKDSTILLQGRELVTIRGDPDDPEDTGGSLGAANRALAVAVARLDATTETLEAAETLGSCKVLFLPCPSRSTSFLVGAGFGLAIALIPK